MIKHAEALEDLLPELEYARETHVQWRDCAQVFRDNNPQIGDSNFHAEMVVTYDKRISTIKEAATKLREVAQDCLKTS